MLFMGAYSLVSVITLLVLFAETVQAISVAWQILLPMGVFFLLMVPLTRFCLAVVAPQILLSMARWTIHKAYQLSEVDSETEQIIEKEAIS